jgi:ribosomal protein S1
MEQEKEIKAKERYTGTVLKTTLQGALVDIGSEKPAFIHISQAVKDDDPKIQINSIEEVLEKGQELEFYVKRVRKDRIELTMKEPLGMEWREIKPGMTVKGTVVRLETFGAFVEIGAERPGLIHISELSHSYVRTPGEVVREGDEIEAKVLEVNRRKKQIKLSVKAMQELPENLQIGEEGEAKKKSHKGTGSSVEQDEILSRTLENKVGQDK